jgi:ATPase family protein associated with various cellular activities (AAA)/AAA+ lid domain-containing protein
MPTLELAANPVGVPVPREVYAALSRAIRAHAGVAYLVTWEDSRGRLLAEELARSAFERPVPCYLWSVTEGLTLNGRPVEGIARVDLATALRHAAQGSEPALYLFRDVHPFLGEAVVRRALRDCFRESRNSDRTVLLSAPRLALPDDLLKEVQVFELPLPSAEELGPLADELALARGNGTRLAPDRRTALVNAVRGLTLDEARIALEGAFLDHDPSASDCVSDVIRFKHQVILKLGILQFIDQRVTESSVGGLDALKAWLSARKAVFGTEARERNLKPPKGVLVIGVPGCGKSLSVQLVAGMWELPLLQLDLATVYSGAFGNPEDSMHRALAVAEAVSPCVLWIDEIEKGIAGVRSSDNGVAARIFGTFLTWMQEKTAPVVVAATANMIDLLPPEILRKGRFDEVFFIDLPTAEEREAIWRVYLERHGIRSLKFSLSELAKMTDQFTASEIEQVVINATIQALIEHRDVAQHDLLVALGAIVPLARTMVERIREIRRWANDRAVPATRRPH